jgi:hypothetical protein
MRTLLGEDEVVLVHESLRRELALTEAKAKLLREELEQFEQRYEMSSEDFVAQFERGDLGDAQGFFEWWGLVRGLKKLEEQLGRIKAVLYT